MAIRIQNDAVGARLALKVVPGASRDRVVGMLGHALKIAVRKPPENGAANRAVVQLLADALSVPPASVAIIRGHTSSRKEVHIAGLSEAALRARIEHLLKL